MEPEPTICATCRRPLPAHDVAHRLRIPPEDRPAPECSVCEDKREDSRRDNTEE